MGVEVKANLIIFFSRGQARGQSKLRQNRRGFKAFFSITSSDSIVLGGWGGGGSHNKFEKISRWVNANLYTFFLSVASSDLIIFGWGWQVGQTNILIYLYYFNCFFLKYLRIFLLGGRGSEGRGAGTSKEYFLFILTVF